MKKFLIAGSSLAAVAAAGSAGAVDVTLGGTIGMTMDFGLGKDTGGFAFDSSSGGLSISLNLAADGSTDAGIKYGGSFSLGTISELELSLYGDDKKLVKYVNSSRTDINGKVYAVSGGKAITDDQIISVKINSDWVGIGDDQTAYGITMNISGNQGPMPSEAICKIAGRYTAELVRVDDPLNNANDAEIGFDDAINGSFTNGFMSSNQNSDPAKQIAPAADTAYLPAGQATASAYVAISNVTSNDIQNLAIGLTNGQISRLDGASVAAEDRVAAAVYIGPFMQVALASSTTKTVVGRVCISGMEESDTKAYLDNVDRLVTASGATIYIDGGFGRLTLSTADFDGTVAAIGEAGDAASVENSGLTLSGSSLSMMGVDVYGAVSLGTITDNSRPNWMLGTSGNFGGASFTFEMEDEADTEKMVDNWDLGLAYSLGDISLAAALDSEKDWGVSADMSIAGLAVGLTSYYHVAEHEKSGLIIEGSVGTSVNGVGVDVSFDQDLDYGISLSYDMGFGGMALTAGYSSADEGGSIGATLNF